MLGAAALPRIAYGDLNISLRWLKYILVSCHKPLKLSSGCRVWRWKDTGDAQGSHPWRAMVIYAWPWGGQVRSRDGEASAWGDETQADHLHHPRPSVACGVGEWSIAVLHLCTWSDLDLSLTSILNLQHTISLEEKPRETCASAVLISGAQQRIFSYLTYFFVKFCCIHGRLLHAHVYVVCVPPSKPHPPQIYSCPTKLLGLS